MRRLTIEELKDLRLKIGDTPYGILELPEADLVFELSESNLRVSNPTNAPVVLTLTPLGELHAG